MDKAIKAYNRNIKIYPHYKFWVSMMIIGPILIPFMLLKGLNYTQILTLQSISAISVFLFEIPTGTIADKISRKFSLVLGSIFMMLGLILYILFKDFLIFALAEIIFGLGITFTSGADSAILYESLDKLDRKKEYQHHEGHSGSLVFIGQGVGSVISSILYAWNCFLPFWLSVLFISFSIWFALRFFEPDIIKTEHSYSMHIIKSFKKSVTTPRILWMIFFAMLMGFAMRVSFWLYQPYFSHLNIQIIWYGLIFFFFNMVAAFASKYLGARFYEKRPRKVLLSLAGLMILSFLLPAYLPSLVMIIILAFQQIVRGMYSTTMRFYINHQVEDKQRATIISIVSLAGSLAFAILSPVSGWLLDKQGMVFTYKAVGYFCLLSTLILIVFRHYQKQKKKRLTVHLTV